MPKEEIDYSNTIIYKIYCKNENITDFYVGHTTNFIQRKSLHKLRCNGNNNKLCFYTIIRKNGGWDNWNMTEIAKYNCKDIFEAHIREHEHYIILKSNVKSASEPYYCNICDIQCINDNEYENHLKSILHKEKGDKMDYISRQNSPSFKMCGLCDYTCSKQSDYEKHILTAKHKERTKGGQKVADTLLEKFICNCGKKYKHRQGLWKHSNNCNNYKNIKEEKSTNDELIQIILKENQEVKQLLLEQNIKLVEMASKNNTIINNTNNNFNLQVFLNVQCKDALNIMEFVESLQIQIKDLENTGRLGYVDGISNIIINGLNNLDISKRPIHCSDSKRETIYIKDKNIWEKENDEKNKLKLAIKTVASNNIKQIQIWQKENPDCFDSSSKKNDQYLKIVSNSMNGSTIEETQKNYEKIISKLSKEIVINKESI